MLKNDFDKYIKENLESAKVSWDKEDMWNQIESELPKKKRRRPVIILVFCLFGLLLLCNYLVKFDTSTIDPKSDQNYRQVQAADLNNNDRSNSLNLSADRGLPSYSDETLNTQSTKIPTEQYLLFVKSNPGPQSKNDSHVKYSEAVVSKPGQTQLTPNSMVSRFEAMKELGSVGIEENTSSNTINLGDTFGPGEIEFLDMLPGLKYSLGKPIIGDHTLPNFSQIKPLNKESPNLFSNAMLTMGYGLVNTRLSSGTNLEMLDIIESSQSALESLTIDASLEYNINRNVFIRSGLELRRINTYLDYAEVNIESNSMSVDTAAYFLNYMGELQYVSGERNVVTRSERQHQLYNEHYVLSMPVLMGYRFSSGHFSYDIFAGPVLNLFHDYKGASVGRTGSLINNSGLLSKPSLLQSIEIGSSFSYALTNKLNLSLGLAYRKQLSSIMVHADVSESYDLIDLNLGLIIKI